MSPATAGAIADQLQKTYSTVFEIGVPEVADDGLEAVESSISWGAPLPCSRFRRRVALEVDGRIVPAVESWLVCGLEPALKVGDVLRVAGAVRVRVVEA
ncbi:MAG: hypothetical protein MH204_08095, partial [Fimbriimonadaceae bacterium]|nr:hypothetical protein [Fimbriimonadaceae bacterium]